METKKKFLTNEKVSKRFISQFDLVNHAIRLAENMIVTGREGRVKIDSQNHALQVIAEIQFGKDQFEELPIVKIESAEMEIPLPKEKNLEGKLNFSSAMAQAKKQRKVAAR